LRLEQCQNFADKHFISLHLVEYDPKPVLNPELSEGISVTEEEKACENSDGFLFFPFDQ